MEDFEIKNVENGEYDLKGNFTFDIEAGTINIKAEDILEMAYALFDWAGKPYTVLDEINEKVEE